ncbi:MAG: YfhO family protein [Blautia sp.]
MEKKDHVQQMRTVLILEVLLFFSGFLVYWDYVFGNHFLAFGTFADVGSDTVQQYLMHYHSVVNHIRNGNVSFWDFNNGFGINVFQMNLFDPTLILLYLIGLIRGANHIWGALVYVQILRILLAGLAGYLFLSEFQFSERSKLLAAYIYGLNGFLMVWGQHYQFGIITIYLPLPLFAEGPSGKNDTGPAAADRFSDSDRQYICLHELSDDGRLSYFPVLLVTELPVKERLNSF